MSQPIPDVKTQSSKPCVYQGNCSVPLGQSMDLQIIGANDLEVHGQSQTVDVAQAIHSNKSMVIAGIQQTDTADA